jgi:hypothetical protein
VALRTSPASFATIEKNEVLDAAGPQDQLKMIVRKCAHSLLVDHEVVRMKNITVKFRGRCAFDEKIVLFDPQKRGFKIRNLRVPFGKSQPHMYDAELILARKCHGFRGDGHDAFGIRQEAENSLLKIQRQKCCFIGIEFHKSFLSVFGRHAVMASPPCA